MSKEDKFCKPFSYPDSQFEELQTLHQHRSCAGPLEMACYSIKHTVSCKRSAVSDYIGGK